jgi:hypothetical protein
VKLAFVVDEPDLSRDTRLISPLPALDAAIEIVSGAQTVVDVSKQTVSFAAYAVVFDARVRTELATLVK